MFIDDKVFAQADKNNYLRVFIPQTPLVVLGSGNKPADEVYVNRCKKDNINIVRRSGGGGAVVLSSDCIVLSFGLWVKDYFANKYYFSNLNQALISSLSPINPCLSKLDQKGLSDICLCEKKLVGTSLFRSRNYLLYQASIIYRKNLKLIETYLPHPSREPDYRQKKSHKDFLTSLLEINETIDQQDSCKKIQSTFTNFVLDKLKDDTTPAITKQALYLQKRSLENRGLIFEAKTKTPQQEKNLTL